MRIGIVNDSVMAREALRRVVLSVPGHEVAWIASDGDQAVAMTRADRPDLILMDLFMPGTDGVEATRRIMGESPCAILVVTATVSGHISKVYQAMGYGALDAVDTPVLGPRGEVAGAALAAPQDRRDRQADRQVAGPAGVGARPPSRPSPPVTVREPALAPPGRHRLVDRRAVRAGGDPLQAAGEPGGQHRHRPARRRGLRPGAGAVARRAVGAEGRSSSPRGTA